jgi:hypothetical protein
MNNSNKFIAVFTGFLLICKKKIMMMVFSTSG